MNEYKIAQSAYAEAYDMRYAEVFAGLIADGEDASEARQIARVWSFFARVNGQSNGQVPISRHEKTRQIACLLGLSMAAAQGFEP